MKGKSQFTKEEAQAISYLIEQKLKADKTKQKGIRAKIRKLGFYASDFGIGGGYTVADFKRAITIIGKGQPATPFTPPVKSLAKKSPQKPKRSDSDESYVLNICDKVLGQKSLRQHRFDFLRGDPGKNGIGIKLPVDAYYPGLNLVIEYREKQHTESVAIMDRRMTVSGVKRGEQRKIYDQRRRDVLPKHGIKLIEISYSDFEYDGQKKIIRNMALDLDVVKSILKTMIT